MCIGQEFCVLKEVGIHFHGIRALLGNVNVSVVKHESVKFKHKNSNKLRAWCELAM